MPHYIALIHKDGDSSSGVSFPDLPGVISAGDTIDEALQHAADVLAFAADNWEDARDAIVAAVPFRVKAEAAQ